MYRLVCSAIDIFIEGLFDKDTVLALSKKSLFPWKILLKQCTKISLKMMYCDQFGLKFAYNGKLSCVLIGFCKPVCPPPLFWLLITVLRMCVCIYMCRRKSCKIIWCVFLIKMFLKESEVYCRLPRCPAHQWHWAL